MQTGYALWYLYVFAIVGTVVCLSWMLDNKEGYEKERRENIMNSYEIPSLEDTLEDKIVKTICPIIRPRRLFWKCEYCKTVNELENGICLKCGSGRREPFAIIS